jgi:hypothetical protein
LKRYGGTTPSGLPYKPLPWSCDNLQETTRSTTHCLHTTSTQGLHELHSL